MEDIYCRQAGGQIDIMIKIPRVLQRRKNLALKGYLGPISGVLPAIKSSRISDISFGVRSSCRENVFLL